MHPITLISLTWDLLPPPADLPLTSSPSLGLYLSSGSYHSPFLCLGCVSAVHCPAPWPWLQCCFWTFPIALNLCGCNHSPRAGFPCSSTEPHVGEIAVFLGSWLPLQSSCLLLLLDALSPGRSAFDLFYFIALCFVLMEELLPRYRPVSS